MFFILELFSFSQYLKKNRNFNILLFFGLGRASLLCQINMGPLVWVIYLYSEVKRRVKSREIKRRRGPLLLDTIEIKIFNFN